MKNLLVQSLLLLFVALVEIKARKKLVGYWGDNSSGSEKTLKFYCDLDIYETIIITQLAKNARGQNKGKLFNWLSTHSPFVNSQSFCAYCVPYIPKTHDNCRILLLSIHNRSVQVHAVFPTFQRPTTTVAFSFCQFTIILCKFMLCSLHSKDPRQLSHSTFVNPQSFCASSCCVPYRPKDQWQLSHSPFVNPWSFCDSLYCVPYIPKTHDNCRIPYIPKTNDNHCRSNCH